MLRLLATASITAIIIFWGWGRKRGAHWQHRGVLVLPTCVLHGTLGQRNPKVFPIIHCNWISHGVKWRYDHVERNLIPWSWHCYCQRVKYGLQLAFQYVFSLLHFLLSAFWSRMFDKIRLCWTAVEIWEKNYHSRVWGYFKSFYHGCIKKKLHLVI